MRRSSRPRHRRAELDRVVDIFTIQPGSHPVSQRPQPATRPSAPPAGPRALQEKVKQAAKSYLVQGNTAVKEDWSEF
jgi:methyl-accepting chemotaxis protein